MGIIAGKGYLITTMDLDCKCPHCERPVTYEDVEKYLSKDMYAERKCPGCKRKIGYAAGMKGYITIEL